MPMLATMVNRATSVMTANVPIRNRLVRPSIRRQMSARATALASTRKGTKSARYRGAM